MAKPNNYWHAWKVALSELPSASLLLVADAALAALSSRLEKGGKPPAYYKANRVLRSLGELASELPEETEPALSSRQS